MRRSNSTDHSSRAVYQVARPLFTFFCRRCRSILYDLRWRAGLAGWRGDDTYVRTDPGCAERNLFTVSTTAVDRQDRIARVNHGYLFPKAHTQGCLLRKRKDPTTGLRYNDWESGGGQGPGGWGDAFRRPRKADSMNELLPSLSDTAFHFFLSVPDRDTFLSCLRLMARFRFGACSHVGIQFVARCDSTFD